MLPVQHAHPWNCHWSCSATSNGRRFDVQPLPYRSVDNIIVGSVIIGWHVSGDGAQRRVRMTLAETGMNIAEDAPRRQGFGTELITRRLAYELRGTSTLEVRPEGVLCTLEFPLLTGSSILQTDDKGVAARDLP
ncbi:sensor histidine kinase [Sphingomonas parva]|uniref:Sensor histidine kinase n=1 Tax=Sphingomonas parva TaxID=2555898 RepID=A0A4Y8ZVN1_9SPHN|nr:sensor histidine kinase [Sphingomonas parva]TFI60113.1 sensor histidine kinase [Sphingomonas parva]